MARSRRKTPIVPMTSADSDKAFKQAEHRRERRAVKATINGGNEPPDAKKFGNPWHGDKDGKRLAGDEEEKLRRK